MLLSTGCISCRTYLLIQDACQVGSDHMTQEKSSYKTVSMDVYLPNMHTERLLLV